jgi:dipeptidyl-peptidase-4
MNRMLTLLVMLVFSVGQIFSQQVPVTKANYELAARFSPKKIEKMVFSTSVDPHWLKNSNRFWYVYESREGKKWVVVDPVRMSKTPMFDNDKLAAALTRIVKDPYDGQHLNIENLKLVKDENWIRFEVKSTMDVEKKDTSKKAVAVKEKKVFFFEYNLQSDSLVELKDHKKPTPKPSWANVSPDQQWVVYAKNFNLYWMDSANLRKAIAKEDDSTIVEHKLTEDGVENYGFGESYGETNVKK